ncbi:HAD-IIA family hydrolase [soil metagenome]|jgi:HAD superfamily hydrolase (TIGR01450 family)|nr:HAD-IIA family hydrolase [Deinococcota bacterium]
MTVKPTPPLHRRRRIDAFAFDLDGTIYLGPSLLPGALALLSFLKDSGCPFVFVTNNSSVSGERYVRKLADLGIVVDRQSVLTSNDVAAEHVRSLGLKAPVLVAVPEVEEEYRQRGFMPGAVSPDCVILTFDTTLTYEKLCQAARFIRRGLPYFATHPDLVCPTLDGPVPDCGSFIALLKAATGVSPVLLGKPKKPMAEAVVQRCGAAPEAIAFVGDRLYTDIRLANDHAFFAVLTLTGEASLEDIATSPFVPDLVVDSLESLLGRLQRDGMLLS